MHVRLYKTAVYYSSVSSCNDAVKSFEEYPNAKGFVITKWVFC